MPVADSMPGALPRPAVVPARDTDRRWASVAAILFASAAFSAMGVCIKAASGLLTTWQVVFWRSAVILLIATPLLARSPAGWRPGNPRRLAIRCVVGLGSMLCFFHSIEGLTLSTATAIQYLSPVFTVLLAGPLLGEHTKWAGRALVGVAFGGVLLVLRPEWDGSLQPVLAGVLGAFFAGWVYVTVRQLRTTDPPVRIVWWFSLTCVLAALPFAVNAGWPRDGHTWWLALGIGLGATCGQLAMTLAYRLGEATRVGPLSYATVVFSALAGAGLFGEQLSGWSVAGMALIIATGAALSAGVGRRRAVPATP